MEIYVLDGVSGISGIIDSYESLIWNLQFYGVGDFELKLPLSHEMLNLLTPGRCLVRSSDRVGSSEFRNVMRIENYKIDFDAEKGWILTVSGGGLKAILSQRVIWDQINYEQSSVEDAVEQVIRDNAISPTDQDREIPDLILGDSIGLTDVFDAQLFGDTISEWLESTCKIYEIGWDVYIKNGKYIFQLIQPEDRTYSQSTNDPVIFSPEFDNLASASYEYSGADHHNVGLIGGEGSGSSQIKTYVGDAAGLDRKEIYIDAGSVSSDGEIISMATYLSMLQTYGTEQLADTKAFSKFTGEIILNGMYAFGVDYNLGDRVQIDMGYVSAAARITEMICSEDFNGIKMIPTFDDWEVI